MLALAQGVGPLLNDIMSHGVSDARLFVSGVVAGLSDGCVLRHVSRETFFCWLEYQGLERGSRHEGIVS